MGPAKDRAAALAGRLASAETLSREKRDRYAPERFRFPYTPEMWEETVAWLKKRL
ncbi:MAG: hypothetical protein ACE15B_10030 [Bryobacteraceae bacterium]